MGTCEAQRGHSILKETRPGSDISGILDGKSINLLGMETGQPLNSFKEPTKEESDYK